MQTFFPSVHCPLPLSLSLSPLIAKLSARNWCSGSPLEVDKNVPTVPSNLVQALVIVPIPNCFVNSLVKSNLDGKITFGIYTTFSTITHLTKLDPFFSPPNSIVNYFDYFYIISTSILATINLRIFCSFDSVWALGFELTTS